MLARTDRRIVSLPTAMTATTSKDDDGDESSTEGDVKKDSHESKDGDATEEAC